MQKLAKYITQVEKDKEDDRRVRIELSDKITLLQEFKKLLTTQTREKFINMYKDSYPDDKTLIVFLKKFNDQKYNGFELHRELDKWIKGMVLLMEKIKIKH